MHRPVTADAVQRDEQMVLAQVLPVVLVLAQLVRALVGQTVFVCAVLRGQQQVLVLVVLPASVAVESFWLRERNTKVKR